MCGTCGCSSNSVAPAQKSEQLNHTNIDSQSRLVQVEQDIFKRNNHIAAHNRQRFTNNAHTSINLVSSPGSGKTTLLLHTLEQLKHDYPLGVIEGDQHTTLDADRIKETGIPVQQINTGKGCHLEADRVAAAYEQLALQPYGLLFIENVGNLVCPAHFDLGEHFRVVILSVTEGDNKPLKYPDIFHQADLLIINKTDLLPYVDFDVAQCIDNARKIQPHIESIDLSCRSGDNLQRWYQWLTSKIAKLDTPTPVA